MGILTVAGSTDESCMVGAWVKTIFGPCFAGRSAGIAAADEGNASSSSTSPCKSSSVTLMAYSTSPTSEHGMTGPSSCKIL